MIYFAESMYYDKDSLLKLNELLSSLQIKKGA